MMMLIAANCAAIYLAIAVNSPYNRLEYCGD